MTVYNFWRNHDLRSRLLFDIGTQEPATEIRVRKHIPALHLDRKPVPQHPSESGSKMASLDERIAEAEKVLASLKDEKAIGQAKTQTIDPYNVQGEVDSEGNVKAIDYDRLIEQFGVQPLTEEHLKRFEKVTGKPAHRLMRRKLFFSHRDFDNILNVYEKYGTFMLYTGRGPSSGSLHLGHTIPMLFTKELQDIFDVPLVIMMTDDEKFLHTRNKNKSDKSEPEDFLEYAYGNIKDIIALGFDMKKTFIYTDYEYFNGHFLLNTSEFESLITNNQVRGAFGFDGSTNVGLNSYGARQCVAAFPSSYPELFGKSDFRGFVGGQVQPKPLRRYKDLAKIPTLIPCAIDQEPYFRILRENCDRMKNKHPKTCLILSKFLTALQGPGGKMSASNPNSAIFMSDTPNQIKNKINKHAFSGGRETIEEHREKGGNPDVDVAFTYLSYFLESDEELQSLSDGYRKGEITTGEMKARCISELQKVVGDFQDRRSKITDEVMASYMTERKLEFKGNPSPLEVKPAASKEAANGEATAPREDGRGTKGERKAQKLAEKKAQKEAEKLAKDTQNLSVAENGA